SEADGRDDRPAIAQYISSAFVVMAAVAAILLVLFALAYPFIDWAGLLHVGSTSSAREVGATLAVTFALFALGIPLGLAQRAQLAYQEGFAVSLWQAVGTVAGLVGLIVAIRFSAGMTGVALALSGGVAFGGAVLTVLRAPIVSSWVGPKLLPPLSFSLALAISAVLYSWRAALVVLLNAANVIMLHVVAALSMAGASLVLKTDLASALGIEGI